MTDVLDRKWNHYTCPRCSGVTVAFHETPGTTPFYLRCRARDTYVDGLRVVGCNGMAESGFYEGSQDPKQIPHVVFFRPSDVEAVDFINTQPRAYRASMLDHYQKGGSLLRDVEPTKGVTP